jgi:hypothetical protein
MNLRSRVARLDDASGELALSLTKLEMEAARGVRSTDEQIDFLRDLHRAIVQREIRPWRSRSEQAALVGILLLAVARFLPPDLPHREFADPAAAILAGIAILAAGACLGIYLRNLRRERTWLRGQEAAVLGGRSILDEPAPARDL